MRKILAMLLAGSMILTGGCISVTPAPKAIPIVNPVPKVVKPVIKPPVVDIVYPKIRTRLNERDRMVLLRVAKEEGLNPEQTNFLLTVRIIENGRPGLELGVGDGIRRHPARRYAGNHDKSLRLQGQWVAGAIKKRFYSRNDMYTFAKRHCPLGPYQWYWNARHYMS